MAASVRQLDVLGQRHSAAVDFQDLLPPVLVGNGDGDFAVEAARPAQGGIQGVGQVGGRQHDDVLPLREAVHQRQQLRHDALFHVADHPLAPRGDGVDLVEEDDARRLAGRLVENLPQVGFALAVELVDDLRAVDREEVGLGFVGHGAGEQASCRSRAGRSSSTPLGASIPSRSNSSGYLSGSSTISRTRSSCRFRPPMSS